MKRLISCVLLITIVVSMFGVAASADNTVSAYEPGSIPEKYVITVYVNSTLSIAGGTAVCSSKVTGTSGVVSITATQTLEKQGFLWIWGTYDGASWSKSVNSKSMTMTNSKSGLSNGTAVATPLSV